MIANIKNEYYFFYELFEEQYNLGKEEILKGQLRGSYSMCVGASELAQKYYKEKKFDFAKEWAEKVVAAFHEFEKHDPSWYNINIFMAKAEYILGKREEALRTYKDMFRKQGQSVDKAIVKKFEEEMKKLMSL